jgi:hypothetical protein
LDHTEGMARHVFYSLHYDADRSRVDGILHSKVLTANVELKLPEWDKVKRSGALAIRRWVENSLKGRSCTIVLIGEQTASRPWVHYEIKRSLELGLGVFGVHVHHLLDKKGQPSKKGANPFEHPDAGLGASAAEIAVYEPPEPDSKLAYHYMVDSLAAWADEAVATRLNKP